MKATPLIINWHDQNAPVYSAHFEPSGKGRLATGGGDNNVRLWQVESNGQDRKAEYLATLAKHNQAVNVVRWAPKGE
jgi:chromatin assembly factor 1 subunit B